MAGEKNRATYCHWKNATTCTDGHVTIVTLVASVRIDCLSVGRYSGFIPFIREERFNEKMAVRFHRTIGHHPTI